jgi:hypothetical protein
LNSLKFKEFTYLNVLDLSFNHIKSIAKLVDHLYPADPAKQCIFEAKHLIVEGNPLFKSSFTRIKQTSIIN